jgi:hypothetical protein
MKQMTAHLLAEIKTNQEHLKEEIGTGQELLKEELLAKMETKKGLKTTKKR